MGTMAKAYGAEIIGVSKVPAGTTDFQQFVLAAEDGGADGVIMPLGNNEAVQVMQAAQQFGTKLKFSSSLGTFGAKDIKDLGAIGKQMYFNAEIPPATASTKTWPVLKNMTADIASDGSKNNQRDKLKTSPMRSWLALWHLKTIMENSADPNTITRQSVTEAMNTATGVDSFGLMPAWTPNQPSDILGGALLAGLEPLVLQREVGREAVRHRQEAAERGRGARREQGLPPAHRVSHVPPRPCARIGGCVMTNFLQVLLTGLGLGSAYALFAQGVVLIYRGSGIVNFAQGALGMLASYVTFYELRTTNSWPIGLAIVGGIAAAVLVALLFQAVVLRLLTNAAPIVRLISTLGLLIVVQAAVELRYGASNIPVQPYLPHDVFRWGDVVVQEQVLYIIGITCVITAALWALARYTRVGLAISAAAQNERAVQTMGWSPTKLSALTWGVGAGLAGIAGVLIAPLTGLSTITFTLIVTVTAMAAALLGGFRSFPLTLLGGFIIGFGEAWVVRHRLDVQNFFGVGDLPGIERAIPFLLILLVLVVRGRGLPLRSHVTDRLPRLGTGA